jgi:hypothetical protein
MADVALTAGLPGRPTEAVVDTLKTELTVYAASTAFAADFAELNLGVYGSSAAVSTPKSIV